MRRDRLLRIADADRALAYQFAGARRIAFRLRERRLRARFLRLRLRHFQLQPRRIKTRQHLPRLHAVANVRFQLQQRNPGDLRIDRCQLARQQLAIGGKRLLMRDALGLRDFHRQRCLRFFLRFFLRLRQKPQQQATQHQASTNH